MFGFLIKKSFCDDWDNLLTVVITNIIFVFVLLGTAFGFFKLIDLFSKGDVHFYQFIILGIILLLGFYIINIISLAFGKLAYEIADFNGTTIIEFFKAVPTVLKDAALFTLLVTVLTVISLFSIWFYFVASVSQIGFFVGGLLFWIDVFLILSLQWFVPIRSYFPDNSFFKCIKKCFIIFFDNTGFSIATFINTIVLSILSILLFGMFPSLASVLVFNANAFRIRMYKYDYLEEHPELKTKKERRQIPWEELIYEDRETLGPRKLKSFLFPWKEDR